MRDWTDDALNVLASDAPASERAALANKLEDEIARLRGVLGDALHSNLAVRDVLAERQAQITREGWTREHDDQHSDGEMAMAASCYAFVAGKPQNEDHFRSNTPPPWFKWDRRWWKPKDPRRDLVRAAALAIAEIERIDRAALSASPKEATGAKHD